jgi:hypothetical protein
VFTSVRGTHYTLTSRNLHWNRVRAAVGIGNVSLYGHLDAAIARDMTRERFRNVGRTVKPMRRSSHAASHDRARGAA